MVALRHLPNIHHAILHIQGDHAIGILRKVVNFEQTGFPLVVYLFDHGRPPDARLF
jgi:hypothetical protein